jgi:hypothetical protein
MRLQRETVSRALNSNDANVLIDAINELYDEIEIIRRKLAMWQTPQYYGSSSIIYARITGSVAADNPAGNRYNYTWAEVNKPTAGYDGWALKTGGRTGTAENGNYARNIIELLGVDATEPVETDEIVILHSVALPSGVTEYWFDRGDTLPTGSTDNPKILAFTQGTADSDTWDTTTDKIAVQLQVVTDHQYDTTSHKLQMKTRTMLFSSLGWLASISAESDWIDIIKSRPCTCAES